MSHARFTENETGLEVDVETVFSWEHEDRRCSIVTYPCLVEGQPGRRFFIPEADLAAHFTIVSPQEIFITAYGGHYDRPTAKQRAISESLVEKA